MDEFKKYLRENRSKLDVEMPPPLQMLEPKQSGQRSLRAGVIRWLAAASVVVLISSALYWWFVTAGNQPGKVVENDSNIIQRKQDSLTNDPPVADNDVSEAIINDNNTPELESKRNSISRRPQTSRKDIKKHKSKPSPLESLETNYATIINYQLKRLERTPIYTESPGYFHVFKKHWYDLEKDEEKIRQDVTQYGLSDIVVDQFIQLYQNKIGLLKQLQAEIDKMNLRARNHPELRRQTPAYLKM